MSTRQQLMSLLRDVLTAVVVVVVVLAALYVYGGRWPPMVVVESESMQHSNEWSEVGVIDTGDLTFVRTLGRAGGVTTWVEGRETGYDRHGEFGDVVVYHKNGLGQTTPIIHRAIVWLEYNATGGGYDVPALDVLNEPHGFYVRDLTSYHTGEREEMDLYVDVARILQNFQGRPPHSGYVTKGDHNRDVDQVSLPSWTGAGAPPEGTSPLVEPVKDAWVVGVARGELPWFGLIKLWASGQTKLHKAPANSGNDLALTVALLLVLPMLVDTLAVEVRARRPAAPRSAGRGRRRRSARGAGKGAQGEGGGKGEGKGGGDSEGAGREGGRAPGGPLAGLLAALRRRPPDGDDDA